MTSEDKQATYNLLDEPWIPVLMLDGSERSMGLLEIYDRAPQVARIVGELPSIGLAIEGLVQAIYRRVTSGQYGGDSITAVEAAVVNWDNWDPVARSAKAYLEAHRDRFDIRHPTHPFYQVADMRTSKDAISGLEVLIADVPNGSPFLTMRRAQGLNRIAWDEAARWLLHVHAFDPAGIRTGVVGDNRVQGGRNYPLGPGWTARLGTISPRSGDLASDLILSSVPSGVGRLKYEVALDLPPWEGEHHTPRPEGVPDALWEKGSAKEIREWRNPANGPVEALTWQSRRVRLIGDDSGVTGVVLTQGDPLDPHDAFTFESRSAWRYSKPQTTKFKKTTYMPRELQPGSGLWRAVESVFPTSISKVPALKKEQVDRFYGPAISNWLAHLEEPNQGGVAGLVGTVELEAVGVVLGSNMSVIADMIVSTLPLPAVLLQEGNKDLQREVVSWVQRAEDVARTVANFASNLYRAAGADEVEGIREEARGEFLASAEPAFHDVLRQVDPSDRSKLQELSESWSSTLRALALEQRGPLLQEVGLDAIVGTNTTMGYMSAGKAEKFFLSNLNKLLGWPTDPARPKED